MSEAEQFIRRWSSLDGGQERANYALFLSELCDLIGVDRPDPARKAHELNDYVFERRVEWTDADGTSAGRIDLYKRGCFILEAKQSTKRRPRPAGQGDLFSREAPDEPVLDGLDRVMIQARRQAERYARALPADHAYPPFIIACDVGRAIELYADFSGHGRHYAQFPDARGARIELAALAESAIRDRLKAVWNDPSSLDPARRSAAVTREIAGALAELSRALEARGFDPGPVALFLMRCLFTMFVEDIGLLKADGFTKILNRCLVEGSSFVFEVGDLWRRMDVGDYSPGLGERVLRFNGKLFKRAEPLDLLPPEIERLHAASLADWKDLEPAIFGTLFEQALDPVERRRVGAHYTPRAYVEIVVDATIMEPLGQDWVAAQAAAEEALRLDSRTLAAREVEAFLSRLASVRVLDPACGTGNFLYVALRRMKQLEGEAVKLLREIRGERSEGAGHATVQPDQFVGIETNPRAVEIAELVLWIGSIQWHMGTYGEPPPEPIVKDADHILPRDALLTWDGYPKKVLKRNALGRAVADAHGREAYTYPNVRLSPWPAADFIVGNPPFVGGKDIRDRLGTSYVEALAETNPEVAPSADFVMQWWDRAARILSRPDARLRRFGFVTTNSITQVFQHRVIERHLTGKDPIRLVMAIPDHPWTRASRDTAAVRIAMTVAERGAGEGVLRRVISEAALDTDEPKIEFASRRGRINADLTVGADVQAASSLLSNSHLCHRGVQLMGNGFIVSRVEAEELGLGVRPGLERHLREYRNGKDLTARSRDVLVIDLFGLGEEQVRRDYPEVYQHLLRTVRDQRSLTVARSPTRDALEYSSKWWLFGKPRPELRAGLEGLRRYIATVETTKHRVFQLLDGSILPDNMIVAIASDDAFSLGVLSSRIHQAWSGAAGGTLEDRPRYTKSRCFDPFPFPDATLRLRSEIAALAEEIDATRRHVLAEHADLTLTSLYNSVEASKGSAALGAKARDIERRGRTLILRELHERLDAAVAAAYGWSPALAADEVLERLVALNQERAAEESQGLVRWLREDYQVSRVGPLAHRAARARSLGSALGARSTLALPGTRAERAGAVYDLLQRAGTPRTAREIAEAFERPEEAIMSVNEALTSIVAIGAAEPTEDNRFRSVG